MMDTPATKAYQDRTASRLYIRCGITSRIDPQYCQMKARDNQMTAGATAQVFETVSRGSAHALAPSPRYRGFDRCRGLSIAINARPQPVRSESSRRPAIDAAAEPFGVVVLGHFCAACSPLESKPRRPFPPSAGASRCIMSSVRMRQEQGAALKATGARMHGAQRTWAAPACPKEGQNSVRDPRLCSARRGFTQSLQPYAYDLKRPVLLAMGLFFQHFSAQRQSLVRTWVVI